MGFVGCVVTVPMLIIQPVPREQYSVKAFAVALWLGVAGRFPAFGGLHPLSSCCLNPTKEVARLVDA
jgi:hypothetical protein